MVSENFIEHIDLLYGDSRDFVFLMKKFLNDYEYVYTNKSARKMLGRDVIGETLQQAKDKDTAKFIYENYEIAVNKNEQHEFEDYAYFDYNVHKHETTVNPLMFEGEQYVLAVTKEISFDRSIQDKYLFMRSVFFKTFLSTVLISNDGRVIEANLSFLENFGFSIEDIQGKSFEQLGIMTKNSAKILNEIMTSNDESHRFESKMLTFINNEGKELYLMASFSPICRGNQVVSIFIIFQDVTEYILQQKQLELTTHGFEVFKRALNQAAEVTLTNLKGEIIEVNDRFIERTGYSREELIGRTHNIVNSKYHPKEFFDNLWETIQHGEIWRGEVRNRKKSGETYWVDTTIIPLTNRNGEVYQYITIHFNVSEKKELMIELRDIERTFRLITENTNDFIVILNEDGKIHYSSPSYIRKLGYCEEELEQLQYEKLIHPDSINVWNQLINGEMRNKDGKIELILVNKNEEKVWTEGNYTLVYDGRTATPSQIIMVSREITERKEREDTLMFLAFHDSLTQLPNRRYLEREFPLFVEQSNSNFESFAVLYIDGDDFKSVNDLYGHDVGDIFLVNFGKTLLASVRKNDLVVRIGGDEFLILIGNLSRNQEHQENAIQHVVANIKKQLAKGWNIGDVSFEPSASIGVAIYPNHGTSLDEILEFADKDLYRVKNIYKNQFK